MRSPLRLPAIGRSASDRLSPLLFLGLMLGLLLSELDQNIFATALPTIVGELHGVDRMLWVTTAYVLTSTLTMPIYGKLGDLLGRKVMFVAALVLFVLGSVIGGLAPDMTWLIVARAVQGLGGGGLLILVQAIVADLVPARERPLYMSVVGAVFALSAVLGPVLGGWLTETVGWRWAFWVNLPRGGLAIVVAVTLLRLPPRSVDRVRVDVWGITTLALAVSALVLLSTWGGTRYPWSSPVTLSLAATAAVAVVAFVLVERRAAEPVIGLHLFRERNFTATTLAGLVLAVAMFGAIAYLPTYLQMVHGLSPTHAGYVMLSLMAGIALTTIGSAQVVARTGRYRWLPVIGALLTAAALAWMSTLGVDTSLVAIGGYLFLLGAGIGCTVEILVVIVQNTFPESEVGTATAANSFFREIGVALGSAVVGTLFTSRLATLLAERVPAGASVTRSAGPAADQVPGEPVDVLGLTPAAVRLLPPDLHAAVVSSYNDALTPVFLLLLPLVLLSVVGLCLIRPLPLATTVGEPATTDSQPAGRPR